MIEAAFDTATRLFGITFRPRMDVPSTSDVRAFEALDAEGRHIPLFYGDYFAPPWQKIRGLMSSFRDQAARLGGDQRPIIINVMNFVKPAAGEPALPVIRRCAHAVPRIRPCPSWSAVRRHLPQCRGNLRAARFR